jgi:tetratricopeptide (TPR) repeat protein
VWFVPLLLLLAASTTFDESYRAGLQALAENRLADARTNLENAAKMEPAKSRVWMALAQTYWKLQEPLKANEAADKAAKLGPGDAQLVQLLAYYYGESQQPVKACDVQMDYAAAAPGDHQAFQRALDCYVQARMPERGYQSAIRLNPKEESYYFEYANSLLQRHSFEAAIRVLEDGKKMFVSSPQLELALGAGYYGLRRFPEAAAAFFKTITLAPDIEQPYLFLGKMLDQIPARVPELIRVVQVFEKAQPSNYAGYLVHAKALLASPKSDHGLAEKLLKKACELNAQIAEPHYELGILHERAQRFPDAAEEFEKAAALDGNDAATHYHLARVYDRLGKPELAERERERHKRASQ